MWLKGGSWLAMALSGFSTGLSRRPRRRSGEARDAGTDFGIEPFSAHYVAEWRDISVGTSDLKLERDSKTGQYHYTWTISARGIFRLVYSNDVTQQSWFDVDGNHIRPEDIAPSKAHRA